MAKGVPRSRISGLAGLAYSGVSFAMTFGFFTCFVIFLGNLPHISNAWIAPTVDTGATTAPFFAALWDLALVALFGLQHSLMARPAFKAWWTTIVPPGLERPTYVLAAALVGLVMIVFWQPVPILLWDLSGGAESLCWGLFALGWVILLVSAINFGIFELLGIRHGWAWYRGVKPPAPSLKLGGLYRILPHPMYVGVLLGIWATPHMTMGHMLIGAAFTAYILIARRYEERDLKRTFGCAYEQWRHERREVPLRS